jgi:CRISPR-associated endonuclease/helicase Cas3
MKIPDLLLAKNLQHGNEPSIYGATTLFDHTKQVVEAAREILNFFKEKRILLEIQDKWDFFEKMVLVGAVFHDLGKATNIFQGMLLKDKSMLKKTHPIRHEILSGILLTNLNTSLYAWLKKGSNQYGQNFIWLVSWVAGGHHLKLHHDQPPIRCETDKLVRIQGTPNEFIFYGSHPDIKKIINMAKVILGFEDELSNLQDIMIPLDEEDDLRAEDLQTIVDNYVENSEEESKKLTKEEDICLSLAKTLLVSADVAGSALSRESQDPEKWIRKALSQVLHPEEVLKLINDKLKGGTLRSFQKDVMESKNPITLVIAGCGNGKTLAAYGWASQMATGKKLFFCYPTTGTASAGFEDYLLAQSSLERTLMHGRSLVDLERILATSEDDTFEENQRLESLKAWSQQIIACTVDTVLGIFQNQRRALFSFPALANGVFVFDEIHNYDAKLFGSLLNFLDTFRSIKALLMSASIPQSRLRALREKLGDRLSDPLMGDPILEETDRYKLYWKSDTNECWPYVKQAIKNNQKVLWVCNTVPDARSVYDEALTKNLGILPIIYHSRFRYKDRIERQEAVIGQLRKKHEPAFVIATQVCEMSLDISAHLMITALAPFPSLIQRLGRLNRYIQRTNTTRNSSLCDCLVYDFSCRENMPYSKQDLEISKKALQSLWGKPCSQRVLAEILSSLQQNEDIKNSSAWLDGRWQSYQRPLREGGASLTVLLEQDIPKIKDELKTRRIKPNSQNVISWTIPMLYTFNMVFQERFGGYPIAMESEIEYDEVKGAKWRKKSWEIF